MTFTHRARAALLALVAATAVATTATMTAPPATAQEECTPQLTLNVTATVEVGQRTYVYAAVKGCPGLSVATTLESSTDNKTWRPLGAAPTVRMTSDWALAKSFDDWVTIPSTTAFRFTAGDQVASRTTTVTKVRTQLAVDPAVRIHGIAATLTRYQSGAALGGRPVAVQTRSSAKASWRTVKTLRTDRYGHVGTELRPLTPSDYRLVYVGDATTKSSATPTRKIAGYVRDLPVYRGKNHTYSTKATRADGRGLAGLRVRVYKKVPGGYKPVTSAVTNSKGVAVLRLHPGRRTTYAWLWPGSYSWQSADSKDFTVTS